MLILIKMTDSTRLVVLAVGVAVLVVGAVLVVLGFALKQEVAGLDDSEDNRSATAAVYLGVVLMVVGIMMTLSSLAWGSDRPSLVGPQDKKGN